MGSGSWCPALSDHFSSLVSVARAACPVPIFGDILRAHLLREALNEGLMWMEGRTQDTRGGAGWAAVLWFWLSQCLLLGKAQRWLRVLGCSIAAVR